MSGTAARRPPTAVTSGLAVGGPRLAVGGRTLPAQFVPSGYSLPMSAIPSLGMAFNFEDLRVWQDAIAYTDTAYEIALQLPDLERFNLAEQLRRAANSIALNIAEGSTSQTPKETLRFLGYAVRSAVECAACHRLIVRRGYSVDPTLLGTANGEVELLFARLQAFRSSIRRE